MKSPWLLIMIALLVACNSKKGVPGDVMPVNDMKVVMWDMVQADEYATVASAKDSLKTLKEITQKLYSKVFAKNKVSPEDFTKSMTYYRTHPAMEKVLLDSLQMYSGKMREKGYETRTFVLPVISVDTAVKKNK